MSVAVRYTLELIKVPRSLLPHLVRRLSEENPSEKYLVLCLSEILKMYMGLFFYIFTMTCILADDSKTSGLSKFWTDDFKVFDQIYGRTSDKDLYGATLPPSLTFGLDYKKPIQLEASEKRERYLTKGKSILDYDPDSYDIGDRYAKLFAKSLHSEKSRPSSALQFVSFSDLKPISEASDPETYNYLKHLEYKAAKEKYGIPKKIRNKLKSYSDSDSDAEADVAYRSIQDILEAHEANKAVESNEDEEQFDLRPKGKKQRTEGDNQGKRPRSKNRSKVRFLNGNSIKSRCISGRCRTPSSSVHSRPYIRKIKYYRYT